MTCALEQLARDLDYPPCAGRPTNEHILPRSMLSPEAKKLVGTRAKPGPLHKYFTTTTCLKHNAASKMADTKAAKLYLMERQRDRYGDAFLEACRELAAAFTVPPSYLRPYL